MPLIECKLRETDVTVGSTTYQFRTNGQGRHVAAVNDPKHIECFLSCTDVYQLAPGENPAAIAALPPVEREKQVVHFPKRGRRRG